MTQVATTLHAPIDLDATLEQITACPVNTIARVDYASVSVTHATGTITTLAATAPLAEKVDQLQYEAGEGPCLDAALQDPVVVVEQLGTDSRWPAYGPQAADLGLISQVAFQFRARHDQVRGALNLYSATPAAIEPHVIQVGALFAEQVAVAMGWHAYQDNLRKALASREEIGIAIGILMQRYGLTPERAFTFLARTSQTANMKLRDVAAGIVKHAAGDAPE